jgi:hypothetical protein
MQPRDFDQQFGGVRPARAAPLENYGDIVRHASVHDAADLGVVIGDTPLWAGEHPSSLSSGFAR